MPRGLPDYYNPDTLVSQRLANVEEVVTALRGIPSIDNRGRTLFFENFNGNLSGWVSSSDEDGSVAVISTAQAMISPASALLDAGTLGNSGSSWMWKNIQLGASALLGFETSLWYSSGAPTFRMDLRYDLAGDEFFARLEVRPASGEIRIHSTDGSAIVGAVGYNGIATGAWLPLKVVADFANGAYTRLIVGQEQIDVSAYALTSSVLAVPGRAEFKIHCLAGNAVTNLANIGHATGTVDEP